MLSLNIIITYNVTKVYLKIIIIIKKKKLLVLFLKLSVLGPNSWII